MSEFTDRLRAALAPTYDLAEELPGGGMSRVFLATERALGRRVVVKVLPPELAAGVNRERFQREIQLAASLQHPHIVPLLAAGEDAELLYYTMPYIEGESLRDRVSRAGRLPVRDVLRILHDVVDALAYAHGRGVVHRDIKPGNILTQGSHALVTDFGVAKAISAALPGAGMTTTGMAIGTPAYMAPEQLAADPAADHRIDLYAVGLLAYELLAGASPFASKSPTETMAAQFTRDPPPLESIRGDVPPALASLVRRLLAKSPAERPADAQQVLAALEEMPVSSGSGPRTAPVAAVGRVRGLRGAGLVVLAVVLLVVAGVAGALGFRAARRGAADAESGTATRVRADTVMLGDSAPALVLQSAVPETAAPSRLTRADSIAIAEAVRAELARAGGAGAAAPAPRKADAESKPDEPGTVLSAALQHRFVDSVLRSSMAEVSRTVPMVYEFRTAPAAPAPPPAPGVAPTVRVWVGDSGKGGVHPGAAAAAGHGPRRVVIAASREDDHATAELAAATLRTMRRSLAQRPEYQPLSPAELRAALGGGGGLNAAAARAGAELVTTIDVIPLPGDSAVILMKLQDLTAAAPFAYRVAASGTIARKDFEPGLEKTVRAAVEYLDEMSRAPRR